MKNKIEKLYEKLYLSLELTDFRPRYLSNP